jgi:hypothetical protein
LCSHIIYGPSRYDDDDNAVRSHYYDD